MAVSNYSCTFSDKLSNTFFYTIFSSNTALNNKNALINNFIIVIIQSKAASFFLCLRRNAGIYSQ